MELVNHYIEAHKPVDSFLSQYLDDYNNLYPYQRKIMDAAMHSEPEEWIPKIARRNGRSSRLIREYIMKQANDAMIRRLEESIYQGVDPRHRNQDPVYFNGHTMPGVYVDFENREGSRGLSPRELSLRPGESDYDRFNREHEALLGRTRGQGWQRWVSTFD